MTTNTTKTAEQRISEAVANYCYHHGVEADSVEVTREFDGDGDRVTRFRLSLDVDGRSYGCDEWFDAEA